MAWDQARNASADTARSYSKILKENRSSYNNVNNNVAKSGNSGYKPKIVLKQVSANSHPQKGFTNRNNIQVNHHPNNKRRPYINQYKKGNAMTGNVSIASKRPAFLDNKCLVISRVSKNITIPLLQEYVNKRAGQQVKFLYEPQNLAKEYSKWRKIA